MVMLVSRRRLPDGEFDAWKVRFEAQCDTRRAAGCRGVRRFRGIEDPNELMVIFDWDTAERAKAFVAMKVQEKPDLLDERQGAAATARMLENTFMEELAPLPS